MPLWFQRSIRDMKVGDTFILGKYTQPVSHYSDLFCVPPRYSLNGGEACFVAEAWIEKERGVYSFYATWTFPTKPGRKNNSVRSFALVCRYLAFMLGSMSIEDKKVYFSGNSTPLFNGVWLDSDCIERRVRATQQIDGKIKRVRINYKDYMPTPQLCAIVDVHFPQEHFN